MRRTGLLLALALAGCSPPPDTPGSSLADVPTALLRCPAPAPGLTAGATVRDALAALAQSRSDHAVCHGRLDAVRRLRGDDLGTADTE